MDAQPSFSVFAKRSSDDSPISLPEHSRNRHLYLIRATGVGKSTVLERVVVTDIKCGQAGPLPGLKVLAALGIK